MEYFDNRDGWYDKYIENTGSFLTSVCFLLHDSIFVNKNLSKNIANEVNGDFKNIYNKMLYCYCQLLKMSLYFFTLDSW